MIGDSGTALALSNNFAHARQIFERLRRRCENYNSAFRASSPSLSGYRSQVALRALRAALSGDTFDIQSRLEHIDPMNKSNMPTEQHKLNNFGRVSTSSDATVHMDTINQEMSGIGNVHSMNHDNISRLPNGQIHAANPEFPWSGDVPSVPSGPNRHRSNSGRRGHGAGSHSQPPRNRLRRAAQSTLQSHPMVDYASSNVHNRRTMRQMERLGHPSDSMQPIEWRVKAGQLR